MEGFSEETRNICILISVNLRGGGGGEWKAVFMFSKCVPSDFAYRIDFHIHSLQTLSLYTFA
jgi:hypothetical protein